ncbi:MAG: YihY/virulence factor BrkB family protein [Bacilli bacterium]|nr:YihY/virulence factor BrkB family protein [Bacilli bacterium]
MQNRIKASVSNFFKAITRPEMEILPGHLAFSFVLSVVPTLTILTFVASTFHVSLDFIGDFIAKSFSPEFANMLMGTNMVVHADLNFILTLIIGYVIASNGAASIIVSSNAIYGINNSGFFKRRIKAFVMILFIILLFVFMLIFGVFGNKIIEMFQIMDISQQIITNITLLISVLKGPISWFIIFLFVKIIFTMAPDKKIASQEVNKGAIFTTVGCILITFLYSLYATNFARYDVFYGNLASIVVLIIWFYLLSYVFTIGLALNYREEVITLEKTAKLTIVEDKNEEENFK